MKPMSTYSMPARRYSAYTLVELMLALLVTLILSVGVCTLTTAALNNDKNVRAIVLGQNEVDLAMRRIVNNIKEAQTGSIVVGTSTLSTLTQSDSADGYPSGATVSYALAADASNAAQKDLVETDQRYGANVLVHNVTTFSVAAVSGYTNLYQVDIVSGTTPISERHEQVYGRN